MKLIITHRELKDALNICSKAIQKNTTIPLLEGVLFSASNDEVKLTTSNFTDSIILKIDAEILEPGEIVIPFKILSEITNKCQADITIETISATACEIKCGHSVYKLSCYDATDFPELPSVENLGDAITVPLEVIKTAIKKVGNFVSTNSMNPIMQTIKIKVCNGLITFVACDGFKLSKYTTTLQQGVDFDINLEKSTIKNISLLTGDNIVIKKGNRRNIISSDDNRTVFITKTISGEYLDYEAALNISPTTTGEVNVNEFGTAINMAVPIIDDFKKTPLKIEFGDEITITSVSNIGTMQSKCQMEKGTKPITIGFNGAFLIDALNACSDEKITIELTNAVSPMIIRDEETIFLILPMRLRQE